MGIDLASLPTWGIVAIFAAGALLVGYAGTRLSRYADSIAERTQLGHLFIGSLLLGGMTSLPEMATTVTASASGNAPLAVNNIVGGIAMQVAILAAVDAVTGRRALSRGASTHDVLLEGVLLVAVLLLAAAGIAIGDVSVLGVGMWSTAVLIGTVVGLYMIKRYEASPHMEWRDGGGDAAPPREERREKTERVRERVSRLSTGRVAMYTAGAGFAILLGGYAVARSGEVLADRTGLGSSFVGAVFIAITTSLPEVTTTLEAVRMENLRLAFSNIFGTNLFDASLLFVADAVYGQEPVLNTVGPFGLFGLLLGAFLVIVYLAGLIERNDRTVLRMGLDSALVLVAYVGGVVVLYALR